MFSSEFIRPTMNALYDECLNTIKNHTVSNKDLSRFFSRCEEHLNFLSSNIDKIDKRWLHDKIIMSLTVMSEEITKLEKDITVDFYLKRDIQSMYHLLIDNPRHASIFAGKKSRFWSRNKRGVMGKRVVIFINGHNQVGKDTFIDLLKNYSSDTIHNISTVDKVKEAATILGWHGEKDSNSREALHQIKMLANKHFNHSQKYIYDFLRAHTNCIIFIHCREPKELSFYNENIPNDFEETIVKTLLIKNMRVEPANNDADKNVEEYVYSDTIWNNDTIEEFKEKSKKYLYKILDEVMYNGNSTI